MNPVAHENVYELAQERIAYIFSQFEDIYLSFSGGKDSGVMLNLVLDYMRANGIRRKISVLYIDVEASYHRTSDFIEYMEYKKRIVIRDRQELWLDVKRLINLRDKSSHWNLGPFTEANYDEFVRTATRVLRAVGAFAAAKQVQQKRRSVACTRFG